nr:FKBP-type peptidyl-prolyl cis-trans isomerase [Providencia sp. JUb39]
MRLNLRLCVSLALFSTCFSTASYAERFNNVIDDFDTYLQSENEGQKPKPRPVEVPLSVKSQAQGYDVLSSLSPVPVPKENRQVTAGKAKNTKEKKVAQRSSNAVTSSQSQNTKASASTTIEPKTPVQVAEPAQVAGTEIKPAIDVCLLPSESQSYQPASSYLLQGNQWNPKYLAKDFAKYQVIIDPLGLYSSNFTKKAGTENSVNLAQLAKLIEQQQLKNLYRFGVAQGVGELISYNKLLTDGQLVTKLTNYNKDIAELNRIITEKQTTIAKLSGDIAASKLQIEQLQSVVKSVDNKAVIDGLNSELAKSQKVIAEKQANLDNLTKQNSQSLDTIKQLEKQLSDGVIEATNAKKQLADKDKQVTDAHQRIEQLTSEIAKLQSDAKQQLQSSGNTDEQLKSVSTNLVQQEALLKQREDELKQAQAQKNDVQLALKQQQDAVKLLEQQNQQLTAQMKQQLADKDKQVTDAHQRIEQLTSEITKLQSDAKQQLQSSGNTDEQLKSVSANLVQQQALLKQREDELKQAQAQKNDVQLALKQQQDAIKQLEQQNQQLADKVKQKSVVEAELATSKQLLAKASTDLQNVKQELENKAALMAQASDKQVKALSEQNQKLLTQLAEKSQQNDKIQATLVEQTAKLVQKNALDVELAEAKKQQVTQQNAHEKIAKQLADSQNQYAQLQAQLTSNEQSYADAKKQLAQANTEVQKLRAELEKQTELAGKDTDLQVKELTAELNKQISLLKGREEALTKLDQENKGIQDSLKAQLSDKQQLESQNTQLMSQAKEKEALIAKLEGDIANRNKQQADIEQKLLDANKQLNALKLDAEKFNAENLSKKDQELLQLKKQLDEKTAADNKSKLELASVQDSLKKAKDELASLKSFSTDEGLKAQIRDLNQRVTQLREENDALRASKKSPTGKAPTIIQIPSTDNTTIAKENEKRNQKILQDIKQQKYSKLDNYTYYKVLQKGTPITNVKDKKITLIMREQLTDGKVTVMHTEKNPMVLPYDQLPPPMNSFVEKVGVGGMVKIYIEPEGGYGPEGIPGEVPPNSMSIIDLKVIQANWLIRF